MSEGREESGPTIRVLENHHEPTKNLLINRIPATVAEGQRALLVVGIREGVSSGPYAYDVNTAAVVLKRFGTLNDATPVVSSSPKEIAEFILDALRDAEQEGEQGKENTAIFWLVKLSANGKPDTSSVRRWTYRAIGTPEARISYDAHDPPTRALREAIKEHARRHA